MTLTEYSLNPLSLLPFCSRSRKFPKVLRKIYQGSPITHPAILCPSSQSPPERGVTKL